MTCKIHNESNQDTSEIEPLIQELYGFANKRFSFKNSPKIIFVSDSNNHPTLGKTGFYNPNDSEITIFVDNRHPKDIMRSISHELIHHSQNERGMFDQSSNTEAGYAQNDPHLRKMEEEAYLKGNMCFRDWEDQYKSQNLDIFYERRIYKMSTKNWKNKELNTLLNERWGFGMNLNKLNEGAKPDFLDLDKDRDKEESMKDAAEDVKLEEEVVEEEGELPADNPEEQALADLLEDMLDKLTIEQLRAALRLKEQGKFESEE
jgi:hypothetical protein